MTEMNAAARTIADTCSDSRTILGVMRPIACDRLTRFARACRRHEGASSKSAAQHRDGADIPTKGAAIGRKTSTAHRSYLERQIARRALVQDCNLEGASMANARKVTFHR